MIIENNRVEFKNVDINFGINDGNNEGNYEGNEGMNNQEGTKKRPVNDQDGPKNQEEILLTNSQKRIVEEMSLNNQIIINDLSKILNYETAKIKSDIKQLRENDIISRTAQQKVDFGW